MHLVPFLHDRQGLFQCLRCQQAQQNMISTALMTRASGFAAVLGALARLAAEDDRVSARFPELGVGVENKLTNG